LRRSATVRTARASRTCTATRIRRRRPPLQGPERHGDRPLFGVHRIKRTIPRTFSRPYHPTKRRRFGRGSSRLFSLRTWRGISAWRRREHGQPYSRSRGLPIEKWCDIRALRGEFFRQRDLEEASGIGLTSRPNDQEHVGSPKAQIGSDNFICPPLSELTAKVLRRGR
jgi:hypothetical protein